MPRSASRAAAARLAVALGLTICSTPLAARADDAAQTANTPATSDAVLVHVDARAGTELRTRASVTDGWVTACVAPCDRRLPRAARYQVVVPGRRPSRSFELSARPGEDVELDVSPNRLGLALGLVMLASGGFSTYSGVKTILDVPEMEDSLRKDVARFYGPLLLASGVVSLVGGVVLPFVDTGTAVSQTSRPPGVARRASPERSEGRAPRRDAFLRVPSWSVLGADARALPAPELPFTCVWTF